MGRHDTLHGGSTPAHRHRRQGSPAVRFTDEHRQLQKTVHDFIEREINPHADAWEAAGAFPAHEVFKKMGALGLLGVAKPEAYGGMGLDYSYAMVMAEELGTCHSGAVSMAIGV